MDPVQAIAARQVSSNRSASEDLDAFYTAHAFASLHDARRGFLSLARLLHKMRGKAGRNALAASEIASGPARS